jgi:hypothetical protein
MPAGVAALLDLLVVALDISAAIIGKRPIFPLVSTTWSLLGIMVKKDSRQGPVVLNLILERC